MITDGLVCTHQPQYDTRCEITWVKLEVAGSQPFYKAAYYRPHEHEENSLDEFRKSLEMVWQKKGNIWVAVDLKFPEMKWPDTNPQIEQDWQHNPIYKKFINILEDFNLTQKVTEPTRGNNVLDLFLTSNDTLTNKVHTIPGISDNDGVCIVSSIKPKIVRPRKVFIYSKATWNLLRHKMESFRNYFMANLSNKSVYALWEEFSSALDRHMN